MHVRKKNSNARKILSMQWNCKADLMWSFHYSAVAADWIYFHAAPNLIIVKYCVGSPNPFPQTVSIGNLIYSVQFVLIIINVCLNGVHIQSAINRPSPNHTWKQHRCDGRLQSALHRFMIAGECGGSYRVLRLHVNWRFAGVCVELANSTGLSLARYSIYPTVNPDHKRAHDGYSQWEISGYPAKHTE